MWGLRVRAPVRAVGPDMFPTHVGIAQRAASTDGYRFHVPYACGDCATRTGLRVSRASCSLRMWGLRVTGLPAPRRNTMFPTHVGIARAFTTQFAGGINVPYACGDCAWTPCMTSAPGACSLRMWGLRGRGAGVPGRACMFPTHVGIARTGRPVHAASGDVPYACGDCAERAQANLSP